MVSGTIKKLDTKHLILDAVKKANLISSRQPERYRYNSNILKNSFQDFYDSFFEAHRYTCGISYSFNRGKIFAKKTFFSFDTYRSGFKNISIQTYRDDMWVHTYVNMFNGILKDINWEQAYLESDIPAFDSINLYDLTPRKSLTLAAPSAKVTFDITNIENFKL